MIHLLSTGFMPSARQVLAFPGTDLHPEVGAFIPEKMDPQLVLTPEAERMYPHRWPGTRYSRFNEHAAEFRNNVRAHDVTHMSRRDTDVAHQLLTGMHAGAETQIRDGIVMGLEFGRGFYIMPQGSNHRGKSVQIIRGKEHFNLTGGYGLALIFHLRHGDLIKINSETWFLFDDPLIQKGHPSLSDGTSLYRGGHIYPLGMQAELEQALDHLARKRDVIPKTGVINMPRASLVRGPDGSDWLRFISDGGAYVAIEVTTNAPEGFVTRVVGDNPNKVIDLTPTKERTSLLDNDSVIQIGTNRPVQVHLDGYAA